MAERIPPGQYKTDKFPVLHYGSVPHTDLATWDFKVWGEVDSPFTLTWAQFKDLPRKTVHTDIHCVTRWTKLDNDWEGVATRDVLARVRVRPEARFVMAHSYGGYTTNLPLDDFAAADSILAHRHGGEPLAPEHGWPLRLVVPRLYFWKSAKWIEGIELLPQDTLGYWEEGGYHRRGDPWREQRYR